MRSIASSRGRASDFMAFITYGGMASSRVRSIGPWAPASTHQTAPPTLTRQTAMPASTVAGCSQLKLRSFMSAENPSSPMPPPMINAAKPSSR